MRCDAKNIKETPSNNQHFSNRNGNYRRSEVGTNHQKMKNSTSIQKETIGILHYEC